MNVIEAIKSGKRFRRKSWTGRDYIDVNTKSLDLPLDAITAEDWEVEEKEVTITAEQVEAACHNAASIVYLSVGPIEFDIFVGTLKKELGL